MKQAADPLPSAVPTNEVLQRLSEALAARKNADPAASYSASLMHKGVDAILKKIGEESAELIIAGKDGKALNIVWEATDLVYHTMVLLAYYDLGINDILQEMRRREGISGIDAKAARQS